MTAAQKKAKDNFIKAIAYRKKTGCSLKEAFAHVYGKKVGAVKKKAAPKKKAVKKAAVKKKVAKKPVPKKKAAVRNYGSHKDTASHNVKISVVSGIGKLDKKLINRLEFVQNEIEKIEEAIYNFNYHKNNLIKAEGKAFFNNAMKNAKAMLSEYKKHKAELKKLI